MGKPESGTASNMTAPDPEFGLFVLWPNGSQHTDALINALGSRFEILTVTEVTWSKELSALGYARFFQTDLDRPFALSLLRRNGTGPALVVGVLDRMPRHTTEHGGRKVNANAASVRAELASRLGLGTLLYASANQAQATRDLMLLLERSAVDAVEAGEWSGTVEHADRDLAGTGGWQNARHMFSVLNTGDAYLVLRNFEDLADLDFPPGHNDIDILTANYLETVALLGLQSRLGVVPRWGGRFDVRIDGRSVICDLRFPGDDYYETAWANQLLNTRQLHPDGFFVPEPDEHLDSLLYHAVVHKPSMRPDYQERLAAMASDRGRTGWNINALSGQHGGESLLRDLLAERGYSVRRPKDPTVSFNHRLTMPRAPLMGRLADALRRRLYRFVLGKVRHPFRRWLRETKHSAGQRWI